ncbi:MAG: hypothetical protein ACRDRD_20310, partial [Pseudonocardiaceae bacterium]
MGEALVSVAKGSSYRVAAELARHKAGRIPAGRRSRRSPANEGQLVANWVDVCSEFICPGQLPERWPHTIAVDSQNFRVNSGPNAGRGFHILAAVGRDQPEPGQWAQVPRVWRLEPSARKDVAAWAAFFGALDGAPKVIVSDADNALALTIHNLFGDEVEHRQCEWHLGRKLRQHLPDELLDDRGHPITRALPDAFHSLEGWERLEHAIRAEHTDGEHRPLGLAVKWIETYGQIARAQTRTREPNGLNST